MMSVLETLLETWDVQGEVGPEIVRVRRLLDGMADVPYENLTKRLASDARGDEELARDHLRYGTGGTCFSLVSLFLTLAERAGLAAEPILADRSYGPNTHCAAVVRTDEGNLLADPGFLIHQPVPLDGERIIELPHTRLRMDEQGKVYTVFPNGHEKFRYQLHEGTVSMDELRDLWDDSFEWGMMDQLVINRLQGDTHYYLRDTHLHANRRENSRKRELAPEDLVDRIVDLGIDREIAREAVEAFGTRP